MVRAWEEAGESKDSEAQDNVSSYALVGSSDKLNQMRKVAMSSWPKDYKGRASAEGSGKAAP